MYDWSSDKRLQCNVQLNGVGNAVHSHCALQPLCRYRYCARACTVCTLCVHRVTKTVMQCFACTYTHA